MCPLAVTKDGGGLLAFQTFHLVSTRIRRPLSNQPEYAQDSLRSGRYHINVRTLIILTARLYSLSMERHAASIHDVQYLQIPRVHSTSRPSLSHQLHRF